MGRNARAAIRCKAAVAVAITALAIVGTAAAFQALPPGGQVNDDSAAGIDKSKGVDGGEPTNADVVTIGPGVACPRAIPSRNCAFVNQPRRRTSGSSSGTSTYPPPKSSAPVLTNAHTSA